MCASAARMVHMQMPLDLSCNDGELGASPVPLASSSSSQGSTPHHGAVSARAAPEALPFQCDQDSDAELTLLLSREARDAPGHSWLHTQPVLAARHRRFLVSWMQRACEQLGFRLATQAMAVGLLDRFLCRTLVQRQDAWAVQLAAVACLTIAAKNEEVCKPSEVIAFQVDASWGEPWQPSQLMAMELAVLQAVEWRVGAATALDFLDLLLLVANVGRDAAGNLVDPKRTHAARNTANSLVMAALQDESCLLVSASCIAASALLLSMSAWCSSAATAAAHACFRTRLDPVALQECLQHMQTQSWQLAAPSAGPSVPHTPLSQLLFVASRRAAEAHAKVAAGAGGTACQPLRSSWLQHCQAGVPRAPALPASTPPSSVGMGAMALQLASEDDTSMGSRASSLSNYCGSPEEGSLRVLPPSWRA